MAVVDLVITETELTESEDHEANRVLMPRKIRELIRDLEKAGFVNRSGKGSHRNYEHPKGIRLTVSGQPGDDVKAYQEREVKKKIREVEQ